MVVFTQCHGTTIVSIVSGLMNIQFDSPHTPKLWLSILVPVYKVQAYLSACASSILSQVDEGVEVVFVDDASPDACPAILNHLLSTYPQNVRVIVHEHNQGISAARNTLLQAAQGEHVWFIDSDDVLAPGALTELKHIIEENDPDLVLCDFQRLREDGSPRTPTEHMRSYAGPSGRREHNVNALLQGLFQTGQWHPWSKIVRRSCWPETLRFPVGHVFEDLKVYPRLMLQIESFYHAPRVWMGYRQRPGSALSGLTPLQLQQWMAALKGYAQTLQNVSGVDASTRYVVSFFCTRTFIRAAKKLAATPDPSTPGIWYELIDQWSSASPLSERDFLRQCWWRFHGLRALQFALWMRYARARSKG